MELPKVIGFSGKIGSGKSTIASLFREQYPKYDQFSFAGLLKEEVSRLYGFPIELAYSEEGKGEIVNRESPFSAVANWKKTNGTEDPATPPPLPRGNMTVREILQWYGTDYIRAKNPDYWVENMRFILKTTSMCIIDDVRFKNEARFIKEVGFLIRILPYAGWKPGKFSTHASETELDDYDDFDMVISPEFGKLKDAVHMIINHIKMKS